MDDLARLESVAQQLVARLRDDDPVRVAAWLAYELPQPKDWYRLCFVLACAVPDDRAWSDLTNWARSPAGEPMNTAPTVRKTIRKDMGTVRSARGREAA